MATNYPTQVKPYAALIEKYSKLYGVPTDVISGTIMTESSGNPNAFNGQNNENSRGLMQISEKTALSTLKVTDLQKLFQPDYNIERGTWYLSFIYSQLKPYFGSLSAKDAWMCVSSSYNQGSGYWMKALKSLAGTPNLTFSVVQQRVLNPLDKGATPWADNVKHYASNVFKYVSSIDVKTVGIGVGVVVALGVIGYAAWMYVNAQGGPVSV